MCEDGKPDDGTRWLFFIVIVSAWDLPLNGSQEDWTINDFATVDVSEMKSWIGNLLWYLVLRFGLCRIVVLCRRPLLNPATCRRGDQMTLEVIGTNERRWRHGSMKVCYLALTSLSELHLNMLEASFYSYLMCHRMNKGQLLRTRSRFLLSYFG